MKLKRLKDLPARQLLGPPALIAALLLAAWSSFERSLFDGLVLLAAFCGALSYLGMFVLKARPRLRVESRDRANPNTLVIEPTEPSRPFHKDAIVKEQAQAALTTMPERLEPEFNSDDSLNQLAGSVLSTGLRAAITGASAQELDRFENKVENYGAKLHRWLREVELARMERLRIFQGRLRICELGHAAADHVHLRLRFPDGFELNEESTPVKDPPKRPQYQLPFAQRLGPQVPPLNRVLPDRNRPIHLPRSELARYSVDDGKPVIDYDLGRVNQSDHRDVASFKLRSPGPGEYKVDWEASAADLGEPARGTFIIKVQEPRKGRPIATFDEAKAEYEQYC